jgi:DNA-binding CsgD family transcriptional regulator
MPQAASLLMPSSQQLPPSSLWRGINQILTSDGSAEFSRAAVRLVLEECGYQHLVLWEQTPDGSERRFLAHEGGHGLIVECHPLSVGAATVGRVEVGHRKGGVLRAGMDQLTPWLALGMERVRLRAAVAVLDAQLSQLRAMHDRALAALSSGAPPSAAPESPESDGGLNERLFSLRHQWHLTRKQHDVLRQVLLGHSYKTAAHALGCSQRTVERHMTELLRKAGADSRLTLVAAFWRTRITDRNE